MIRRQSAAMADHRMENSSTVSSCLSSDEAHARTFLNAASSDSSNADTQRSFTSANSSGFSDTQRSVTSSADSSQRRTSESASSDVDSADVRHTSLVTSSHLSSEFTRMTQLLANMDAECMKNILQDRLRHQDTKTIVAFSILFPRTEFPAVKNLHCVRCHKQYDPSEQSTCLLPHPGRAVRRLCQDKAGATFRCSTCRLVFRLTGMFFYDVNVNSYLTGFCFSGGHTTNPRDVNYNDAAHTCESSGCVELYV